MSGDIISIGMHDSHIQELDRRLMVKVVNTIA